MAHLAREQTQKARQGELWIPQGPGWGQNEPQRKCWADPGADKTHHWGSLGSPGSATGVSDKWAHLSGPQSPLL